ncbi:hypothetical protein BV22DRAFT_271792 [Leucogyrophana mollusca]|uniref:Uncharacterized protein n=1 Tax=Leucogyrophana mollusca TaxID=85980 RepID=A0ACB8BSE5_9AGAM|nr:hypothetical protein BV22DRAFT_271792 [Leucogyrophana mollusca]
MRHNSRRHHTFLPPSSYLSPLRHTFPPDVTPHSHWSPSIGPPTYKYLFSVSCIGHSFSCDCNPTALSTFSLFDLVFTASAVFPRPQNWLRIRRTCPYLLVFGAGVVVSGQGDLDARLTGRLYPTESPADIGSL